MSFGQNFRAFRNDGMMVSLVGMEPPIKSLRLANPIDQAMSFWKQCFSKWAENSVAYLLTGSPKSMRCFCTNLTHFALTFGSMGKVCRYTWIFLACSWYSCNFPYSALQLHNIVLLASQPSCFPPSCWIYQTSWRHRHSSCELLTQRTWRQFRSEISANI